MLQHRRHGCQKAQMSDFIQVVAGTCPPHTHLALLTPNQHTLTCRYINDLVLRQPAYPQTGDVLRSQPFLSPIEQAYLELCCTNGARPETLFHSSFITKVHLLSHSADKGHEVGTQGLTPATLQTIPQLSPFSFPSCIRKGDLFAHIPMVFARGVTKRVH